MRWKKKKQVEEQAAAKAACVWCGCVIDRSRRRETEREERGKERKRGEVL